MKLPLQPLVHLLHAAPHATLATISVQVAGYPYATLVPNVLDQNHQPLLLVSALAEHTRNLLADCRVSLSLVEAGARNVQSAARLSLIGDAEPCTPEADLLERYLRYQPDATQYLQLDFVFFRIQPRRIRYIAGLGKMGWIEPAEWQELPRLEPAREAMMLAAAQRGLPPAVTLLGLDHFGIDYEKYGVRARWPFPNGPLASEQIAASIAGFAATLNQSRPV